MPNIYDSYRWAINVCNAPNVGYSMKSTLRNQGTYDGVTYYDCSSFINFALVAGGFSTPSYAPTHPAFSTGVEPTVLTNLGFTEYSVSNGFTWKECDIGWRRANGHGHTEMCYKGGENGKAIFMGAHTNGVQLANQVSIGTSNGNAEGANSSFTKCYRWEKDNSASSWQNPDSGDQTSSQPKPPANQTNSPSMYVVAAMCANFWAESNINPAIYESLYKFDGWTYTYKVVDGKDTGGYGLGQWTNTGGDTNGRLYKLNQWLTSNNYTMDSLEGQLKYIVVEDVWHKGTSWQQEIPFATLKDFLYSDSTDLKELTKAWMYCWEGIRTEKSLEERQDVVDDLFKYIQQHADDTSIKTYVSGNRWLSETERKNNAVMVWRLMNGKGGGGGTKSDVPHPTHPQKPIRHERERDGLPVWMMIRYR